jgi:hypothetical protein
MVRFMRNLPRCGTYRGIPGDGAPREESQVRTKEKKNEAGEIDFP